MPRSPAQHRFADCVRRPEPDIPLAEAALLVAAAEYDDLDIGGYLRLLDLMASRAAAAVGSEAPAGERLRRMAAWFESEGFKGNRDHYYDARNSYLNDVLDRRLGLPITLSIVLVELGRRVGLPLHGVGLPAHFLVKWQEGAEELFLDPFHGCDLLTEQEAAGRVKSLAGPGVRIAPQHFARAGTRTILRRMLNNLRAVHLADNDVARTIRTLEMILILEPEAPEALRDLGLLYRSEGRFGEATVCLERFLELMPEGPTSRAVRRLLGLEVEED